MRKLKPTTTKLMRWIKKSRLFVPNFPLESWGLNHDRDSQHRKVVTQRGYLPNSSRDLIWRNKQTFQVSSMTWWMIRAFNKYDYSFWENRNKYCKSISLTQIRGSVNQHHVSTINWFGSRCARLVHSQTPHFLDVIIFKVYFVFVKKR